MYFNDKNRISSVLDLVFFSIKSSTSAVGSAKIWQTVKGFSFIELIHIILSVVTSSIFTAACVLFEGRLQWRNYILGFTAHLLTDNWEAFGVT